MSQKSLWIAMILWCWFSACGRSEGPTRILRIGFVPSENVQQVAQNAQPIVDLLQKKLGMDVQPFVATDYTGVVEALRSSKLDIAFLSPASYVLAKSEAGVKVILKSHRKGSAYYYAAIITHSDSPIKTLEDLRNRTFAFGDPLSTTGHVFPRKMFKGKGIDPVKDFKNVIYSGGHDATVLAVLHRKVDAGATFANFPDGKDAAWIQYLKDPAEQQKIRAIAYSEPIPADNLVASEKTDPELVRKVEALFLDLGQEPAGKKMLRDLYQIDGFMPASDRDYDPVREAFKIAGINLKEALQKKKP
ncbi:MAG: phosphate/phosphite/phosphonate ABC transporter substrate-binding protein [Deltaproteobacteria bacterium]|nr:phosphate/phosphite/phosphonate ABC transporter substrate-binding protein [Deltaproteobacteria bacterium]